MQLLPNRIRKQLPPLHATDGVNDPLVICQLNAGNRVPVMFFLIEFDGKDTFYGLSLADKMRKGHQSLKEIKRCFGKGGVERDPDFTPRPLSQVRKEIRCWL